MCCTGNISCLVIRLLMAWSVVSVGIAGAQQDGGEEPDRSSKSDDKNPIRMTIVHHGSGNREKGFRALFPNQVRELESDDARFTGLFLPQQTSQQQGGAVIIPDEGRSPAQGVPSGLRRALPEYGWSTVAISLAESDPEPVPERIFGTRSELADQGNKGGADADNQDGDSNGADSVDAQGTDKADKATGEPSMAIEVSQGADGSAAKAQQSWRQSSMARIEAAVALLRSSGIQNIALIGVGAGADLALRYADANAARFPSGGLGTVWLDARFREPYNKPLDEVLGDAYEVPILDLYQRGRDDKAARSRRTAAERGGFKAYSQSALPIPRHRRETARSRLGAWVGGWLKETMAGMETN